MTNHDSAATAATAATATTATTVAVIMNLKGEFQKNCGVIV